MLYRVSLLLLLATFAITGCKDDGDGFHKGPIEGVISISGPNAVTLEHCGDGFMDSQQYEITVSEASGAPLTDVVVRIQLDQYLEFFDAADSVSFTDENGKTLLEIASEYFGDNFWFQAISEGDTASFQLSIMRTSGAPGCYFTGETDTLLYHPMVTDSIDINVMLMGRFGQPLPGSFVWFSASSGLIDTSMQVLDSYNAHVYWHTAEPVQPDDVFVYVKAGIMCGHSHNPTTTFLHDTTSFILAPAP